MERAIESDGGVCARRNYIKQTRCRQHFVSFEDYFGGADGYREERLKKINRFEKKEEGEEGDAWTKEFDELNAGTAVDTKEVHGPRFRTGVS